MKMKLASSTKGFLIGAIVIAIIAYFWGAKLLAAARTSGFLSGATTALGAGVDSSGVVSAG